jgi:hypothetical protein
MLSEVIIHFDCRLYSNLTANHEWTDDLHGADAILIATHSQGSIVSAHLLDRLIRDKHIKTSKSVDLLASASAAFAPGGMSPTMPSAPRVCCLALCGIHLGPLRYLSSSSLLLPYIQVSDSLLDVSARGDTLIYQYFESAAAKELFEFQVRSRTAPRHAKLSPNKHLIHLHRTPTATSRKIT